MTDNFDDMIDRTQAIFTQRSTEQRMRMLG